MIKRYDIKFSDFCDNCGCSCDSWYEQTEKGIFVKYTDVKHLLEKSDNKANLKFPSLKDVSDYIGWAPDETMTIQAVYKTIKKLGNFE